MIAEISPMAAPDAVDDTIEVEEDVAANFDPVLNDSDPDDDEFSVISVTQGDNGTVLLGDDGRLTYVPDIGFVGSDSFTYTVRDENGEEATATVNATVVAAPDLVLTSNASRIDGRSGDDTLTGQGNDQELNGRRGDDTLDGGSGNDTLNGGPGTDSLTGGTGTDAFVFNIGDVAADIITDYEVGETLRFNGQTLYSDDLTIASDATSTT
ncbi:MAG: Ig-like domain-containing protein, partial [Pseudomonadota bacterium]